MKKKVRVLAAVIIAIFIVGVVKDLIIKSVITVAATQITGAPVHIDGFSLGVFSQSVRISGFRMYNPEGFSRGVMVDLPKIRVSYDLGALLRKKLHLANVEIEIKEMGLEKNKESGLNVDALKVAKQEKKQEAKPGEEMPMQIDVLTLGMGKIVFKDYSAGKEPVIKVYDINIHKSYKNITNANQLAALILAEPMKAAGIQGAAIYGISMFAGVAILPVGVAAAFAGKDSAKQDFTAGVDDVYDVSLAILKQKGKITKEDKAAGAITAVVNSAQVTLKIRRKPDRKTELSVSARRYMLPKPEIAAGIIYAVSEKIK